MRTALRFEPLGDFPTPIHRLDGLARNAGHDGVLYVKRDDLTSAIYGGNKVRTLEVLFAQAKLEGSSHVVSTGAYGSNHAVATSLHAPRVGLTAGALLFPQPESHTAADNFSVVTATAQSVRLLWHWTALPFAMWTARKSPLSFVMVPGGATPRGALGYVSAAFELAQQVKATELPCPAEVIVGVGSTCTSAGLLVGFRLASRLGIGFGVGGSRSRPPRLVSVRVTPWPVTSRYRILRLAVRTSQLLARLTGRDELAMTASELGECFSVDNRYLGRGYGYSTPEGLRAIESFSECGGPPLDTTYSAKAAAAALARLRDCGRPILFWATKSSAPLPPIDPSASVALPPRARRWLERARAG